MRRTSWCSPFVLLGLVAVDAFAVEGNARATKIEEVTVWARAQDEPVAPVNPVSVLTPADMVSINAVSTEDLVKFEPSLVIRRRFIGDANGTLGLRGSNMFQTSRSMVFADGVPLHYFLQSRWNGAPRWTMVSASEVAQVEVLYGPFSAEYSGNAMGGVVLIETAIPQQREFHIDGTYFNQSFDAYGFDDDIDGYKGFVSYGDKIGQASLYFSYNRLQNDSQPQSYYYGASGSGSATVVSGAVAGQDERGVSRLFFGDTGIVDSLTDNYKVKIGYDFDNWQALVNLAYEDRSSISDAPNSYLRDASGATVWSGTVIQDGQIFSVPASRLSVSALDRRSLSAGLRIRGELTDGLKLETNLNQFAILEDLTRTSAVHPNDPPFTAAGEVMDFDDTGWQSAELKLSWASVANSALSLVAGFRFDAYELNIDVYASDDYRAGHKTALTSSSGGQTRQQAAFAQLHWPFSERWDISLGGRYEHWRSDDGYYTSDNSATPELDVVGVPKASKETFSPKFAVGLQPADQWILRYSLARAYRFPIVEELFSQYQAFNAISQANPELKPEDGIHHNLMLEKSLVQGYLRLNIYRENIRDVIESQSTTLPGGSSLRTFIPVDEVETEGVELVANVSGLAVAALDVRFNVAYTESKIIKNKADPSIEGNDFPRMPRWRGNVLMTYHLNPVWDVGATVQYASNSFGRLDNSDTQSNVYGAQDAYLRIGFKTGYQYSRQLRFSVGVDNLNNDIDYVAHPWPGRTVYFNASYNL